MKIVLASASPRRKKLLKFLVDKFEVLPSSLDEKTVKVTCLAPAEIAVKLAMLKAQNTKQKLKEGFLKDGGLIIGADTLVVLGQEILGKPKNRQEAINILGKLKGTKHAVITGLTLLSKGKEWTGYQQSQVIFKNFTSQDLKAYLDKNAYLDKAGAYGIQDLGTKILGGFKGSYSNILGLPLKTLAGELERFNVKIKPNWKEKFKKEAHGR